MVSVVAAFVPGDVLVPEITHPHEIPEPPRILAQNCDQACVIFWSQDRHCSVDNFRVRPPGKSRYWAQSEQECTQTRTLV
jgi:hypothetical protein